MTAARLCSRNGCRVVHFLLSGAVGFASFFAYLDTWHGLATLVPLVAHDRAGFGRAVCSCGVALL